MAIPPGHTKNFETMRRAFENGDVALLECKDAKTQQPVIAVCMVSHANGEYTMTPVAKMFDGNPFEELIPPEI